MRYDRQGNNNLLICSALKQVKKLVIRTANQNVNRFTEQADLDQLRLINLAQLVLG